MDQKIIIAIDGYSSCGKSTLARALARRLRYRYIDTGAMYRAVTLFFIRQGIGTQQPDAVAGTLDEIEINFRYSETDSRQLTILNGQIVEEEIRTMQVSQQVSQVSTLKEVRRFLVAQQKAMGLDKGIIMDGRDIGTVVFPDAELKLFMTAQQQIRVQRRLDELQAKGVQTTREEVEQNLLHRDHIDSTREESPLRKAEDAILFDNSFLTQQEQLDLAERLTLSRLEVMQL